MADLATLLDELVTFKLKNPAPSAGAVGDRTVGWELPRLVRYLEEAQRRFCRQSLSVHDGTTPSVVEVRLIDGVADYTLHRSVLGVISAKYVDDSYDLVRVGHSLFAPPPVYESTAASFSVNSPVPPGRPRLYQTDEFLVFQNSQAQVSLRVVPTPTAAEAGKIIKLRVVRMPITSLTMAGTVLTAAEGRQVPDIPEDYHLDLVEWATFRALRNIDAATDADIGNMPLADKFRVRFDEVCEEANRDVRRKLFQPLQWSFGNNGFTWQSQNQA